MRDQTSSVKGSVVQCLALESSLVTGLFIGLNGNIFTLHQTFRCVHLDSTTYL
jgi:hypothetical protein